MVTAAVAEMVVTAAETLVAAAARQQSAKCGVGNGGGDGIGDVDGDNDKTATVTATVTPKMVRFRLQKFWLQGQTSGNAGGWVKKFPRQRCRR